LLALDGVSDAERASVVGTFSSFFDMSQGLGALICGTVVAFTGDRGAFTTGAICAIGGLLVLRSRSYSRAPAPA
jgi:predicted MFS family arabinose efflux permease